MNLAQLMKERRTVHNYRAERMDEALIMSALEVAVWAPNHRLTHPWRFTLVGPEVRAQLGELSVQMKEKESEGQITDEMRKGLRAKMVDPAALVVVSMPLVRDEAQKREDYASIAAGLQNTALFLWSKGVGTKWATGKITRHAQTYKLVGISPDMEEILGFFWMGYADKIPPASPRPGLEKILRRTT